MERAEIDTIVQRLVEDPHDEASLAYAHQEGEHDPKAYALLLERVGNETRDPAYAAHWLAEAGNVWATTLGDAHRAARVLMMAIDKDPTAPVAAERLAQLYREKGDAKALVALLDRRAKALAPLVDQNADIRSELAGMYEELGRLWSEPPLSQPKKAVEQYRKAFELDPSSAYAIYSARELYKTLQDWENALPLYGAEIALEADPGRRVGLLRDEASVRKLAGDFVGVTRALADARALDVNDPGLQQEYASSILDRMQAGESVPHDERSYAAELLVALAETYEGDHGFAYAGAALDIAPGHDRGLQLYEFYARALGRENELAPRYAAYLEVNASGSMAEVARGALGDRASNAGFSLRADSDVEPATAGPPNAQRREAPPQVARPNASPAARASQPPPLRPSRVPSAPAALVNERSDFSGSAPPAPPLAENLQDALEEAQKLVSLGKKLEAYAKYKDILALNPAHAEALGWTEDYLRSKRDYAQLRDVLLASIRATAHVPEQAESRKERLREVAGLCEGNLRDIDGAMAAWRQLSALDRTDESARTALMRLLERSQRWDDLANLLEQEATIESDVEAKIGLEKKLAKLQEDKRKDLVATGEAWGRIARLRPGDESATLTASRFFERGERLDLAALALEEGAPGLDDAVARGQILQRLAELREQLGQKPAAGDAFAEAAEALRSAKAWEEAERLYREGEAWEQAASAIEQRALLTGDVKLRAQCFAQAAEYLVNSGELEKALECLEQATDLDPLSDAYAEQLLARYDAENHVEKRVAFLTKRGDRLTDTAKRTGLRREAATLASSHLKDRELARELWLKLLEDGDDKEALEHLIDDAIAREDHTEAATLLRRLGQSTPDKSEKARIALREAALLAEGVGDVDTAISRYEHILTGLDTTCRQALQAIADLQEARGATAEAADALERELKLASDVTDRGRIASRLAGLYDRLEDPRSAIRALDLVRKADPENGAALTRLCVLCEQMEQWSRLAELLAERIASAVETEETELVALTKKLAHILADKLDRGDEALAALTNLADQGEASVREAYLALGDRLGWKGIVAGKLKEWWFDARSSAERTAALRGAFERFEEVGRDTDAIHVAIELVRTKGADKHLAEHLEDLAVKTSDHDALVVAHELLAREVQGEERGYELVRQAEVRARAGLSRTEAIGHGEQGLSLIAPGEAEPVLDRLAQLAAKPVEVVDLYERQVLRTKAPADRVRALARAAQVASLRGQPDRARGFFELSLVGAPSDETLDVLEQSARDGDKAAGADRLRRALCQAFAAGGHGARDGGRSRASLLRRAAMLAHRDLHDVEQAFAWLGDALVAHVDTVTLDLLESLGIESGDPRRTEAALTHALGEVFDGPLVRQLLARRANVRRTQLADPASAIADLKRLHDLSPHDQDVMNDLAGLLIELRDYKVLVQLYEDQILRGKDVTVRAELARQVARLWEEQLRDAREAADTWRRVLRMKAGDLEATQGLERAKSGALKSPEGLASVTYAPPKLTSDAATNASGSPSGIPRAMEARMSSRPPASAPPSSLRVPSMPPPLPAAAPPLPAAAPPLPAAAPPLPAASPPLPAASPHSSGLRDSEVPKKPSAPRFAAVSPLDSRNVAAPPPPVPVEEPQATAPTRESAVPLPELVPPRPRSVPPALPLALSVYERTPAPPAALSGHSERDSGLDFEIEASLDNLEMAESRALVQKAPEVPPPTPTTTAIDALEAVSRLEEASERGHDVSTTLRESAYEQEDDDDEIIIADDLAEELIESTSSSSIRTGGDDPSLAERRVAHSSEQDER